MIYFDGCYMAKYYLSEADSPQVTAAAISTGAVASSLHARLEVLSVFHRKLREGQVTASEFQLLCDQFETDCAKGVWSWFPVTWQLLETAGQFYRSLPATVFLRAADALHLASAKDKGFTEIYSNDRHLLAAAPHFGLTGVTL